MRLPLLMMLMVLVSRTSGQEPSPVLHTKGFASLTYANDYFTATDRYFTQGVGLRVGSEALAASFLMKPMLRLHADDRSVLTLLVQQDCYTPASIRTDTIRPDDRPFAGAMYVGVEATSSDPDRGIVLRSSLIAGVLGPCASCGEEQRWIHHGLGDIAPLGWQYQVAPAVLVNYAVDVERRLYASRWLEARGGVNGMLGSYMDNVGATATVELGQGRSVFDPATDRPLKPQLKGYGRVGVQVVGYDASMQGGVFQSENPHVLSAAEIERAVAGYGWGARFSWRRLDLQYSEWYISRTFKDGLPHGWGTVVFRGWF